jgi:hypothetical protein
MRMLLILKSFFVSSLSLIALVKFCAMCRRQYTWNVPCQPFCGSCLILYLLGCQILPDTRSNKIHLRYLRLLEDFDSIKNYSWGSACLATLYRRMCDASITGKYSMGGCARLLQVWAWSRITNISLTSSIPTTYPFANKYVYNYF